MHPAASGRTQSGPTFSNHTPRPFEIERLRNMTNTTPMSRSNTSARRKSSLSVVREDQTLGCERATSLTFHSPDHRFESYSSAAAQKTTHEDPHYNVLELAPILSDDESHNDKLMARTNLQALPPSNPSFQMAYFLRTTGPRDDPFAPVDKTAKTSKSANINKLQRKSPMPKKGGFRLFRHRDSGLLQSSPSAHERLNDAINGEDSQYADNALTQGRLPDAVQQKTSMSGSRYLQIDTGVGSVPCGGVDDVQVVEPGSGDEPDSSGRETSKKDHAPTLGRVPIPPPISMDVMPLEVDVLESRVSVLIDDIMDKCAPVQQFQGRGRRNTRDTSNQTVRILTQADRSPVRPSESKPPTPTHDSGIDFLEEERLRPVQRYTKVDANTPLSSNPRSPRLNSKESYTALPLLTRKLTMNGDSGIIQPSPQRVGSHPILTRSSSDVTALCWSKTRCAPPLPRSTSSPVPPPPARSPLRLQQTPPTIENTLTDVHNKTETVTGGREVANSTSVDTVPPIGYHHLRNEGSMSRVDSSSASTTSNDATTISTTIPLGRRFFANGQLQSKPLAVVQAAVEAPVRPTRRRLRRTKPHDHPSIDLDAIRKRISLTLTREDNRYDARPGSMQQTHRRILPMMRPGVALPIEAVPPPGPMIARRAIAIPVNGRRSPRPRPRSAKMPSRASRAMMTPPRSESPEHRGTREEDEQVSPDLPSPPPRRSLPPTPKKSTHESGQISEQDRPTIFPVASEDVTKRSAKRLPPPLPLVALQTHFPSPPSSQGSAPTSTRDRVNYHRPVSLLENTTAGASAHGDERNERPPTRGKGRDYRVSSDSDMEGRLEALERHNRLLESALMAVLKTNGMLNGCPFHHSRPESGNSDAGAVYKKTSSDADILAAVGHPAYSPCTGGNCGEGVDKKVTRKESVASRGSGGSSRSGSAASALDVYLSTRGR